jgi:NAD(P) transhydrogenase
MSDGFDLIVIGGGPAGQKAAVQGAKLGRKVLLIERSRSVGGACVRFGTIPSKTLRETALALGKFRRLTSHVMDVKMPEHTQIESLMTRKEEVIASHESYMGAQLARNGIEQAQGVARFLSANELEITDIGGGKRRVTAPFFVIATGSSPRTPDDVPIDHEHILDSDSILSVSYLPESMTVLGSGVIACEYASIFAALGTKVTIIDRSARPLAFLDPEISTHFSHQLQQFGGQYLGGRKLLGVAWDGLSMVETRLDDGQLVQSEKLFCALGRIAQVQGLAVEAAGIGLTPRGLIAVDEHGRTAAQHIYAVGDVIGPPALASTSMDQGRRAVCHAFGAEVGLHHPRARLRGPHRSRSQRASRQRLGRTRELQGSGTGSNFCGRRGLAQDRRPSRHGCDPGRARRRRNRRRSGAHRSDGNPWRHDLSHVHRRDLQLPNLRRSVPHCGARPFWQASPADRSRVNTRER